MFIFFIFLKYQKFIKKEEHFQRETLQFEMFNFVTPFLHLVSLSVSRCMIFEVYFSILRYYYVTASAISNTTVVIAAAVAADNYITFKSFLFFCPFYFYKHKLHLLFI